MTRLTFRTIVDPTQRLRNCGTFEDVVVGSRRAALLCVQLHVACNECRPSDAYVVVGEAWRIERAQLMAAMVGASSVIMFNSSAGYWTTYAGDSREEQTASRHATNKSSRALIANSVSERTRIF